MKKTILIITFVALQLSHANPTDQTEASQPCTSGQCAEENKKIDISPKAIAKAIKEVDAENAKPKWIDSYFMYEVTKANKNDLEVSVSNFKKGLTSEQYSTVYGAYSTSFGTPASGFTESVKSFDQAIKFLSSQKDKFSTPEKLALLSMIGSKLSAGYSSTTTQNPNLEALFQNAKKGLKDGGICGDIHTYVSKAAEALGFEAVGIHSGKWFKDLSIKEGAGHAISHFRDPKTGEYYMQNYSNIYNTKQKNLQDAVDVSTRILGPLTGASDVTSRPGVVHIYVPKTAEWIKSKIESQALSPVDDPIVTLKISNKEQTIGVQIGNRTTAGDIKGFFVHSTVPVGNDKYSMDAIGASLKGEVSREIEDSVIDQIGLSTYAYGGLMQMQAPVIRPEGETEIGTAQNGFMGAGIKGTARINKTTGKLEFNYKSIDLKSQTTDLTAGVEQKWDGLPLTAAIERKWSLKPKPDTLNGPYSMTTDWDKVGVVWDQSSKDGKVFLTVGTEVFMLEGAEKMSAIALKNSIKAAVPVDRIGTFSVIIDYGKVVQNKSKDPYYDLPATKAVTLDFNRKVYKAATLGAQVTYNKGPSIQPFSVIGPVSPELPDNSSKLKGMLYFHYKF